MRVIHLPTELRAKTIQRVDQIKPGVWFYAYGIGGEPANKPVLQEVCGIGEEYRDGYTSFITNENCFVAGIPGQYGSVSFLGNYYYADWNIGRNTSNWFCSFNEDEAKEVFEYLLFFSRLIDT